MLEPTQRSSIVAHRDLIHQQIRLAENIDETHKEILYYKARLLILLDAFKHKLPPLQGDFADCNKQCDYAEFANQNYVNNVTQQMLADIPQQQFENMKT